MAFNQSVCQGLLSLAFGINTAFVVPKQGNWYNPQALASDGSKPDTWCSFRITQSSPVTLPYNVSLPSGGGVVKTAISIATIDIQLVGEFSEAAVQSMQFWNDRTSIIDYASSNGFSVFYESIGKYNVSTFIQDGVNTVLAYNASFRVQWLNQWLGSNEILTTVNTPTGILNGVNIVN